MIVAGEEQEEHDNDSYAEHVISALVGSDLTLHKFPWRAPVPCSVRHRCGPVPSAEGDQKSFSKDKSAGRGEKPRRKPERRPLIKPSMGILGWPGHPSEHRGRRVSLASIAALRDHGGHIQEMPNWEGSMAACVETTTLWGLSIAALRDIAPSAKTGGSSRRQRYRDLNPHELGRRQRGCFCRRSLDVFPPVGLAMRAPGGLSCQTEGSRKG